MSDSEHDIKYRITAIENVAIRTKPITDDQYLKGVIYKGTECKFVALVDGQQYTNEDTNRSSDKWYKDRNGDFFWSGGFEDRPSRVDTPFEPADFWWVKDYGFQQLWNYGLSGKGVKVAVLDSGLSIPHSDLDIDKDQVVDMAFNGGKTSSNANHGTHCSGIIKASNNGFGIKGIAYNCDFYFAKVSNDEYGYNHKYLIAAIEWAIQNEVQILSISQGDIVQSDDLHEIIKKAVHEHKITCIVAGGNKPGSSGSSQSILTPAIYDEVISVGALDQNGDPLKNAIHTSQLKIYAPGENILSTYPNNTHATESGTSQAAPMVAGLAALVLEAYSNKDVPLNPDELESLLTKSTKKVNNIPIIDPSEIFKHLKELE